MKENNRYIAIDLKSFYASVECAARGLDPLGTNLVVADPSRTDKTICLAVSPSLKSFGVPGRPRLFEVVSRVREVNEARRRASPHGRLTGESSFLGELNADPSLAVSYIVAPPRMAKYMEVSTQIYNTYLKYVAEEDIFAYSVDEVFIDVTKYLATYKCTARELAMTMIRDVLGSTGITATAGVGTNMYLAKIAMDVMAKKMKADSNGVRIAELDEMSYRRELWDHRPLTSFWRVGSGTAARLASCGMHTMGDIARCSVNDEDLLYKLFGVNAELLIDHAWGWEPTTVADVKSYRPRSSSLSSGQVLSEPYECEKARLIVREMIDHLSLDLVAKRLVTDQIMLDIGYDVENLADSEARKAYRGETVSDRYGRSVPKYSHGTENLSRHTSSSKMLTEAMMRLFDRIADKKLTVRRLTVTACNTSGEDECRDMPQSAAQLDLFTDYEALRRESEAEKAALERERHEQEAIIELRRKFGKNAVLKGMNYIEGATEKDRNKQIGGHKA